MNIHFFKPVHLLCTMEKEQLKATHYACYLSHGMWGLWTINDKFVRHFGSRSQIEDAYPTKSWRRRAGSSYVAEIREITSEQERAELTKSVRGSGSSSHQGTSNLRAE